MAVAEISEDELGRFGRTVRIDSVRFATIRNKERQKVEVFEVSTSQDERDTDGLYLRVTVELKHGSGEKLCAQLIRQQCDVTTEEYAGRDQWEFYIPHGELKRPRIDAYVVEYGLMDGENFVPVATRTDDADDVNEIIENCSNKIAEDQLQMKHSYVYRDGDEELDSEMTVLAE
ncbi:MAG: hypothetical protein ISR84_01785 [Kiritimatiellales bacterium]|nr:hypothetical protein [Kiritimatiellales bacterium]